MQPLPERRVLALAGIDLRMEDAIHPYERRHADAIEANWADELRANPALFDGRLAMFGEVGLVDGVLTGTCNPVRFATFLHFRRQPAPEGAHHIFAQAMPVAPDGSLLAVRMAAHTANPGEVYFAAGSLEAEDFPGGRADIALNMRREVCEETGIDLDGLTVDGSYFAYSWDGRTIIVRRYLLGEPAEAAAMRVTAFVSEQENHEIDGPVVLRGPDHGHRAPSYMAPILDWHFGTIRAEARRSG